MYPVVYSNLWLQVRQSFLVHSSSPNCFCYAAPVFLQHTFPRFCTWEFKLHKDTVTNPTPVTCSLFRHLFGLFSSTPPLSLPCHVNFTLLRPYVPLPSSRTTINFTYTHGKKNLSFRGFNNPKIWIIINHLNHQHSATEEQGL